MEGARGEMGHGYAAGRKESRGGGGRVRRQVSDKMTRQRNRMQKEKVMGSPKKCTLGLVVIKKIHQQQYTFCKRSPYKLDQYLKHKSMGRMLYLPVRLAFGCDSETAEDSTKTQAIVASTMHKRKNPFMMQNLVQDKQAQLFSPDEGGFSKVPLLLAHIASFRRLNFVRKSQGEKHLLMYLK